MTKDDLSYGEKLADGSNFTIYCFRCDRQIEFDPTNVTESKRPLGARFRCSVCHEPGLCITSPKWRPNACGDMIPYGTPPNLPDGFYGKGEFIGPPRGPIQKRRRRRR